MIKKIIAFFPILLVFGFATDKPAVRIFLAGDSTMSIKETGNYPETGWGMPFVYFWDSSVSVINLAKNGRSTKTFITGGLWNKIMQNAAENDFVIIQFGHNDEVPTKVNSYTTPDTFQLNLTRFINEARQKKAIPVLCSPVARRKFSSSGELLPSHEMYSKLVKEVALREKVVFIDLDYLSQALYSQLGVEQSKLLFVQLKPGEHPNYPDGKEDNTHFNELGARMIAQIMLKELTTAFPVLGEKVVKKPAR
jgi:lysophospholipase L1-like esterase